MHKLQLQDKILSECLFRASVSGKPPHSSLKRHSELSSYCHPIIYWDYETHRKFSTLPKIMDSVRTQRREASWNGKAKTNAPRINRLSRDSSPCLLWLLLGCITTEPSWVMTREAVSLICLQADPVQSPHFPSNGLLLMWPMDTPFWVLWLSEPGKFP